MAPRRKSSNWFEYKITPATIITIVGWIVIGTAFYTTTNSTLASHEKALEKVGSALSHESTEREKVRTEFLTNSSKTAEGIAELNKQIAVLSTLISARYQAEKKVDKK
jgi:hypothetical protein